MSSKMFHVEHNPTNAMSTPNSTPAPATLQLNFRADVRNPRTYTATEGSNAGKTYYTADAELSTPCARWSTIRIKVRSKIPIVAGPCNLLMVTMDGSKGEGVADIVEA